MIVIINGPLGIGKTTTAWELLEMFESAAMLDGDYLGAVQPFEIYDPARVAHLYDTLRLVAGHHRAAGYSHLIINYVFETPEELSRLRSLLADLDSESYAFRLTCDEAEADRRIRQRGNGSSQILAWEMQRFRQLSAIQNANASLGDLGYVVDTTHLSAQQAAQTIYNILYEPVTLAPYNPSWSADYERERAQIAAALGDLATRIEHIGSTAVPGLCAKSVIDILVGVRRLEDATACIAPLAALGYTFMDYPENTERRFFRKGMPRTHHLHICAEDGAEFRQHLAFRDALRRDPALAEAYAALKTRLAEEKLDRASYSASKGEFIRQV